MRRSKFLREISPYGATVTFLREISPYGATGAKFSWNSTGPHTDLKMVQIPGIFEILRSILGPTMGHVDIREI